jgi:hypothetical protein
MAWAPPGKQHKPPSRLDGARDPGDPTSRDKILHPGPLGNSVKNNLRGILRGHSCGLFLLQATKASSLKADEHKNKTVRMLEAARRRWSSTSCRRACGFLIARHGADERPRRELREHDPGEVPAIEGSPGLGCRSPRPGQTNRLGWALKFAGQGGSHLPLLRTPRRTRT